MIGMERESDTEKLVGALARDLMPVQRIPPLRRVALGKGLLALSLAAAAVGVLGLRPDVRALAFGASYAGIIAGLWLFALGGLLAALGASVPGRQSVSHQGLAAMALALALWLGSGLAMLRQGAPIGPLDAAWLGLTGYCLAIASAVGLLPALALLRFVTRAFPYRPAVALGVGAAGMVAFGSLSVHLTCSADELLHVASAHLVGPIAAGALLGLALLRFRSGLGAARSA